MDGRDKQKFAACGLQYPQVLNDALQNELVQFECHLRIVEAGNRRFAGHRRAADGIRSRDADVGGEGITPNVPHRSVYQA